jgi:hypothetical protein
MKRKRKFSLLLEIPYDIKRTVFEYLNTVDLYRVSKVCVYLRSICSDILSWEKGDKFRIMDGLVDDMSILDLEPFCNMSNAWFDHGIELKKYGMAIEIYGYYTGKNTFLKHAILYDVEEVLRHSEIIGGMTLAISIVTKPALFFPSIHICKALYGMMRLYFKHTYFGEHVRSHIGNCNVMIKGYSFHDSYISFKDIDENKPQSVMKLFEKICNRFSIKPPFSQ